MNSDTIDLRKFNKLGVCFKDKNCRVLQQNEICQHICGNRLHEICDKGCLDFIGKSEYALIKDTGIHYYHAEKINNEYYDLCLINTGEGVLTLFYSLKEDEEKEIEFWKRMGLTKRELEISLLKSRGKSHSDIEKELFISKSTLKTHVNNIYRKLSKSEESSLAQ